MTASWRSWPLIPSGCDVRSTTAATRDAACAPALLTEERNLLIAGDVQQRRLPVILVEERVIPPQGDEEAVGHRGVEAERHFVPQDARRDPPDPLPRGRNPPAPRRGWSAPRFWTTSRVSTSASEVPSGSCSRAYSRGVRSPREPRGSCERCEGPTFQACIGKKRYRWPQRSPQALWILLERAHPRSRGQQRYRSLTATALAGRSAPPAKPNLTLTTSISLVRFLCSASWRTPATNAEPPGPKGSGGSFGGPRLPKAPRPGR